MTLQRTSKAVAAAFCSALVLSGCASSEDNDHIATRTASNDAPAIEIIPSTLTAITEAVVPEENNVDTVLNAVAINNIVVPHGAVAVAGMGEANELDFTIPSWSTIKVPIAIAALRQYPALTDDAYLAITYSDNDAATRLWESLEDPVAEVAAVLSEGGVKLSQQSTYSSYGATQWTVSQQATFASNLRCIENSEEVVTYMSDINVGGDYGLGVIPGALFKGGWGPESDGVYGVRQFGLIPNTHGYAAVAIAATSPDGSYEGAQDVLTEMALKLEENADRLPGANC